MGNIAERIGDRQKMLCSSGQRKPRTIPLYTR